ncbi:anti-sigma factor RsbA family regulatory protein [Saccharothrix yanglingensis]|uniref:Transcriptional regulator n=1 Tax=Saccharothrix yanglingensis TaxID=659496 RepID=A0ABU0WZX5_9PSEU|nr:anti-sigma factor RsbA family regulatory protein [Saccharothrix yanglingensis]MDQ2585431.1 transcriptional regulator [Saccharothrix yanglingensis]
MRTDAHGRGYDHSAAYYASDEDLLSVVVPFLLDGLEAGEPTVVSLTPERSELVRSALPRSAGVVFTANDDVYARPASAIRSYREMMAGFVADGARGIRIAGEVPKAALTTSWDWWARYESAVNHAYDDFPLRSMCLYDTRDTPRHVLDDVARTHPFALTAGGGRRTVGDYVPPPAFLAEPRPAAPLPIESTPPLADVVVRTSAEARRAVADANRARLPAAEFEDLLLSVSEVATNAVRHGSPPVRLRVWADRDRVVVEVHDTGAGPTDPFAGLLPAPDRDLGGLGLWLVHQLCAHVALRRDESGFAVRLVAGDLPRA